MRVLGHAGAAGDDLTQRVVVRTQHVEHREEAAHLVCVARNRVPPQRSLRQQRAQHRAQLFCHRSAAEWLCWAHAPVSVAELALCQTRAALSEATWQKGIGLPRWGGATEVRLYVYTARIDADSPPYVPHQVPLVRRVGLPRDEIRSRPRPLRGPDQERSASSLGAVLRR